MISVQLNDDKLNALLDRVDTALNYEGILDDAGAVLLSRVRKRFLQQVNPDGSAWPESQAARRRKATGEGGGTLYDTGSLFQAIQLFDRGQRERAVAVNPTATNSRTGAKVEDYAIDFQEGLNGQEQRTVIGVSDDDINTFTTLIVRRVRGAVGNG